MSGLFCRLGWHRRIGYVSFVFASYRECQTCGKRWTA